MSSYLPVAANASPGTSAQAAPLDQFISRYMQVMNAPGLTLALANKNGVVRTAGFGYSDLEQKTPVTPDLLFEIGSITKSFVALTLLQLRQEGKLDLQKPVLDYLPWLPVQTNYGFINTHHLLTHSSGLPDALDLFLSNPETRHIQAFKPGEHFVYCNLGFSILGFLIEHLDGKPWSESVRGRILEPLKMGSTSAVITDQTKARRARSYVPFNGETSYLRSGRLTPAPDLVFDSSAGSIISTPEDMARYLQMLLNRGRYGDQRIVSEESFTLFSNPYIKASEFSPTASYGYGIAVDKLDGHATLRHTGGMTSFASSIHVDLESGVAAFASINAMQGYRPVPVTQFAVQTMNAQNSGKESPQPPDLPIAGVKHPQDYVGVYSASDGSRVEVKEQAGNLLLHTDSTSASLEHADGDIFLSGADAWNHFPIVFGRAEHSETDKTTPVVELQYGSAWYVNQNYTGPRSFPESPDLLALTGFYQFVSAWSGSIRVVLRKGKLWADGVTLLDPIGDNLFRVGEDSYSPDTVQFLYIVNRKARMLKWNGADALRIL